MRARAVAIIIDRSIPSVLLIHRWKDGREYYVLPGGKIEDGETPAEACAREALEETGLQVAVGPELISLVNLGRPEHYFLVDSFTGALELGFPERDWQTPQNIYQLEWVPAHRFTQVNLFPVEIRPLVARCLQNL